MTRANDHCACRDRLPNRTHGSDDVRMTHDNHGQVRTCRGVRRVANSSALPVGIRLALYRKS
jgi:hypothetical protein